MVKLVAILWATTDNLYMLAILLAIIFLLFLLQSISAWYDCELANQLVYS